jgi:putrescine importer
MIPRVPYVVIAACFAGGITSLNVRGIRATARANQVLMSFMGLVLVAFVGLAVRYLFLHQGWGGVFSALPFCNPREFDMREVLHATSFAPLTYIGFDSITTLAEDAYNPKRNVLLATVIVCLFFHRLGGGNPALRGDLAHGSLHPLSVVL